MAGIPGGIRKVPEPESDLTSEADEGGDDDSSSSSEDDDEDHSEQIDTAALPSTAPICQVIVKDCEEGTLDLIAAQMEKAMEELHLTPGTSTPAGLAS